MCKDIQSHKVDLKYNILSYKNQGLKCSHDFIYTYYMNWADKFYVIIMYSICGLLKKHSMKDTYGYFCYFYISLVGEDTELENESDDE